MSNELAILKFRGLQIFRYIRNIGLVYIILLIPIFGLLLLMLTASLEHNANPYVLSAAYPLLILMIHGRRKDIGFLSKIKIRKWIVFLCEYQLIVIPLSLLLISIHYHFFALAGHLLTALISIFLSLIQYTIKDYNSNWSLHFIPNTLFEWKGIIRKYDFKLLAFWILGLFMAQNEYAIFLFVIIFTAFIPDAFKATEGKELKPLNTKELHYKLWTNSLFVCFMVLPHLLIYVFFNPAIWWVALGIILYLLLNQLYAINFKYAYYSQYQDSNNEIPSAIFILLSVFIPISIPLIIMMYFRAKKNLRYA